MVVELIVVLLAWVVCGVVTYGLMFAHFQRGFALIAKDDYRCDVKASLFMAAFGPLGLIATVLSGCFLHGLKFR